LGIPIGKQARNGRSATLYTTLKIAVVAPMPSATTATAAAANPGALRSRRKLYFIVPTGISNV
jgi:hypothetical protein